MAKKDTTKKERAKKYDKKLAIGGTLDNVLKVSIPRPKKKKDSK